MAEERLLSLRICQEHLPKIKQRETRLNKKRNRISKNNGTTTKDVNKHSGTPEEEESEKGIEEVFKAIMNENFCELICDTKPQIQEAQRTPSRINTKKLHLSISYLHCRKLRIKKKKSSKEVGGRKGKSYL